MELILQEVTTDRYVDIPEEVLDVYRLWRPVAAVPRAPAGEGARHAGEDLLQVRGRVAGRLAQAQHRRAAGVLQRQGRDPSPHHRDRRRPVGHRARVRLRAVRPRVRGVAGAGVVRPEAVPEDHDRDVRRGDPPVALGPDRGRPGRAGEGPGLARVARASRSPRRSRSPRSTRTPTTRSGSVLNHVLLHQTIIGEEALLQLAKVGCDARPHRRLHRRRLQLRRAGVPVPAREAGRADGRRRSARSSRRAARR